MKTDTAVDAPRVTGQTNLLRLPRVIERVDLGTTAIYALIKKGQFPAPVKLGRASAWPEDEIDAFIAKLKAARPATPTTDPSS